jgi:ectoine hydroxylase-related dioxygenase (phytanoyl-CoA dioxygenase family)
MQHYLNVIGVSGELLTPEEKDFLDTQGYLVLGKILKDHQLEQIRNRIEKLMLEEGEQAGSELLDSPYIRHPKEAGADRLADLVNKDPVFDVFYTHPRVLAAISRVLGRDLKLSSLNYRAAKPGTGDQKLHVDWHEPVAPGEYKACNSIWLLDDFTADNGATRIVPGSHLNGQLPQVALEDPWAPHPGEIILEGQAGTVVVFNSHVWHGGTRNRTTTLRRAIHSYFCRRDQPQQVDQRRYLRQETRDRLAPEVLTLLDV